MSNKLLYIIATASFFISCSIFNKNLKPKNTNEYISWYNSPSYRLRDTVVSDQVVFVLTGVTKEVDCARMISRDPEMLKEVKAYYDTTSAGMSYELKVELPTSGIDIYSYNPKSLIPPGQRTSYFSFEMKKDIKMVSQHGDTLDCSYVLHERGMSNSPYAKFMMEFTALKKGDKAQKILVDDKALTGKQLEFNITEFESVKSPKLRFE